MIKLSKEKTLSLHEVIARETGGDPNIREMGLLESALEAPFATFDGIELYPSIEEKAARLGTSLIANHAFVDGNKRIGVYAMLIFLEVNGISVGAENKDVVELGLGTASGSMKYEDVLAWIHRHCR